MDIESRTRKNGLIAIRKLSPLRYCYEIVKPDFHDRPARWKILRASRGPLTTTRVSVLTRRRVEC